MKRAEETSADRRGAGRIGVVAEEELRETET